MKQITYKSDTYELPFKITCTVSGVVKTYTSVDYINGKLDRFGGLEKLRANYVSRDAKRAAKKLALAVPAPTPTPEVPTTIEAPVSQEVPAENQEVPAENQEVPVTATPEVQAETSVAPEIAPEVPATETAEVQVEKPIAKKDKNGKWRNAKGHLISEYNLANFQLVEA